jgi:hypothetical protein
MTTSRLRTNLGALLLGFVVAALFGVYTTAADTSFGGVLYTWPSSHGSLLLKTNGTKTLTWDGAAGTPSVPAGIILYTDGASCPTGWASYGNNGEYFVGLVTTLETPVATALSNLENRATGTHTHTHSESLSVSASGHTHSITDPGHSHDGLATLSGASVGFGSGDSLSSSSSSYGASSSGVNGSLNVSFANTDTNVSVSATQATITDYAGTAGTNAPYIQLRACRKS